MKNRYRLGFIRLVIIPLALLFIFSCNSNQHENMNPILGNDGVTHFYSNENSSALSEKQRIVAHLTYVLQMLTEQSNRMSDGVVKMKRFALLNHLREYIRRAEFPINSKYNHRQPCFIDENGTYCAVGYLIQQTAGSELAEKINALFQYDYLSDMKLPDLDRWVAMSGFSLEELAMIQPTYGKHIIKNTLSAGAGMSYRGLGNGYPSFRLTYGKAINEKLRTIHGRMEVVGKNDFYSSLSMGYVTKLSNKAFLRNRHIGVLIGPALLIEEGQSAWLIKPEIQLNLFSARLFKNYFLSGLLGYAYDVSLTKSALFPTNRNDLSLHLVIGRTKSGMTY